MESEGKPIDLPTLEYIHTHKTGGLILASVQVGALLGGVLAAVGALTAWLLLRAPQDLARRGGNHPAWVLMYLLLLGLVKVY